MQQKRCGRHVRARTTKGKKRMMCVRGSMMCVRGFMMCESTEYCGLLHNITCYAMKIVDRRRRRRRRRRQEVGKARQ